MAFVTPDTERFARDLERTVDRLRGMALTRLSAAFDDAGTRADAAHRLAQALADASADLRADQRRAVPRLADAAVGDQLAVCGRELLVAAQDCPGAAAEAALAAGADALLDLRRRV